MRKHVFHDYARFSRKSRLGIITLLSCILLLALLPFLFPMLHHPEPASAMPPDAASNSPSVNRHEITQKNTRKYNTAATQRFNTEAEPAPVRLFLFDPNRLDDAGWLQLGLKEKTVRTLRNYLSKGGRFRSPEDLRKIWGLAPALAEKLIPYVRIEVPPAARISRPDVQQHPVANKPSTLEINSADTSAWIALPGIGSKLAARILAFREKLGGFYRVEQVGETYGLADSVFQRILPRLILQQGNVRKLSINGASLEELKSHPYIRYATAHAIVQYRQQHGRYNTLEDLKNIAVIHEELFRKIAPYLTTE